jgi:hypothetical protein
MKPLFPKGDRAPNLGIIKRGFDEQVFVVKENATQ